MYTHTANTAHTHTNRTSTHVLFEAQCTYCTHPHFICRSFEVGGSVKPRVLHAGDGSSLNQILYLLGFWLNVVVDTESIICTELRGYLLGCGIKLRKVPVFNEVTNVQGRECGWRVDKNSEIKMIGGHLNSFETCPGYGTP